MALKDWGKIAENRGGIYYRHRKTGEVAHISPVKIGVKWVLFRPKMVGGDGELLKFDYSDKVNAKKALMSYMRSH